MGHLRSVDQKQLMGMNNFGKVTLRELQDVLAGAPSSSPVRRSLTDTERLHLSYQAKLRIRDAKIESLTQTIVELEARMDYQLREFIEDAAYKRRQRIELIREYRRHGGTKPYREMASMDTSQIGMAIRELFK